MNPIEKIDAIDEALRIVALEHAKDCQPADSEIEMARVLSADGPEMAPSRYELMIDRLFATTFQPSLGHVLADAIAETKSEESELAHRIRIPVTVLQDLLSDNIYTNNVPIVLFKNLLLALNISFENAKKGIEKTFSMLQGQTELAFGYSAASPAFRRRSQHTSFVPASSHVDGRELFENKEALGKYLKRLEELMQ